MKAILRLHYTDKLTASIRYYNDPHKVVKSLDGLNIGTVNTKPKHIVESLLAEHHDPTACKAARTFIISAATPKDATPEQLKAIDAGLEKRSSTSRPRWVACPWSGGFMATPRPATSTASCPTVTVGAASTSAPTNCRSFRIFLDVCFRVGARRGQTSSATSLSAG